MIGLNTEEFTDSLNDIIILLVSCMVSEKGQRVLKLSHAWQCDMAEMPKQPIDTSDVCPRASVVKGQGYGGPYFDRPTEVSIESSTFLLE